MAYSADVPQDLARTCEAAGFGDIAWPQVLEGVAHAVGGIRGILLGGNGAGSYSHSCVFNHDPEVADAYNRQYNKFDPRAAPSLLVPVGNTRLGQSLMPNSAFAHTEYFDAISRKGDIADSVFGVISNDPELGRRTISVQRGFAQDFFDSRDALVLKSVLPLLDSAMRNSLRVGRILAEERGTDSLLYGLVDAELDLILLPGSETCGPVRAGPIEIGDHRLVCSNPAVRKAVMRAISRTLAGETSRVRAGAVTLRFDPVPAALHWYRWGDTQVFLTISRDAARAHPCIALFAESFGLTRREADLLAALLEHDSMGDAAEALGVATETARWHAKNICAKTGHAGVRKLVEAARTNDLSNLG